MKERFNIGGMTCSACSSHVEKAVNKLDGVKTANVNLLQNSMMVDYDKNILNENDIIKAVTDSGYTAIASDAEKTTGKTGQTRAVQDKTILDQESDALKNRLIVSIVFLVPLLYVSMGHMLGLPIPGFLSGAENGISFALTQMLLTLPIIYINRAFFISGFKTLVKRAPNMDSLVALGASAAFIYGVYVLYKMGAAMGAGDLHSVHDMTMDLYFESAAVILTLITVGKYLEARSKGKTSDAMKKLLDLAPKTATRLTEGNEEVIPIENVKPGDILIVKSGEGIPVDGVVTNGKASVDQSMITGESMPVDKSVSDQLTAGTINKSGFIKMEATRVGEDTTLAGIIRLVEDANTSKAPIARLADKVSGVFVPVVICIAIITGAIWLIAGYSFDFALTMSISVLVISCPCALGLATPTAIMVGTGKGAEQGILFKTAESLEVVHKIDVMILDKTGTVTEGKLSVTDIKTHESDRDELIKYAASAEALSEHPLGMTIVNYARNNDINLLDGKDFQSIEGRGIKVTVNGQNVTVGNIRMMLDHGISGEILGEFETIADDFAGEGKTPLFVALDGRFLGVIAVADTIKPTSKEAVKALEDQGIEVVMITGDNEKTAKAIAEKSGIAKVISDVLPADKEGEVRKLQEAGKKVAMTGDGINDSPALARADVGIAIGAGTDIAIESADIVLIKSDLMDAVIAIDLSRAVVRNIKQNLFWAFFYNIIGIPLAAGVLYPALGLKLSPMFAAAAMSISSFSVVTNALRLRFFKPDNKKYQNDEQIKKGNETMKKTVAIEGMSCMHCSSRVEEALNGLDGVTAKVDLDENEAIVKTDSSIDDDIIKKVVEDAGYQVVSIK